MIYHQIYNQICITHKASCTLCTLTCHSFFAPTKTIYQINRIKTVQNKRMLRPMPLSCDYQIRNYSKVFFIKHCQTERHYYNEYISINTHVYTLSSHDQQSKSVPFCQSFTLQIHMWLKLNVLVNTEQNHLSNFLACLLNNSTRASLWIGVIEACLAHAVVWLASNMLHKLRNYLIFIIVWFR